MKKHEQQLMNFLTGTTQVLQDKLVLEEENGTLYGYIATLEQEVARLEAVIEELVSASGYEGRHAAEPVPGLGDLVREREARRQDAGVPVSVGQPPSDVEYVGGEGDDPVRRT